MDENIVKLVNIQSEYAIAKQEFEAIHAKVKKHHNEVYAPMCEQKKLAKARLEELELQLVELLEQNSALVAAIKRLGK